MKLLNFRVIGDKKLYGSQDLEKWRFRYVDFSIYQFVIKLGFHASPLPGGYGYIANIGEGHRVNFWLDCQKKLVDELFESLEENDEQSEDK
jgi:hypothetical protein